MSVALLPLSPELPHTLGPEIFTRNNARAFHIITESTRYDDRPRGPNGQKHSEDPARATNAYKKSI